MLSKGDSIKLILGTLVILLIAGGIWYGNESSMEKSKKDYEERYEKMVDVEGKFKLTQKILDEDQQMYVDDIERVRNHAIKVVAIFAGSMILSLILVFVHKIGLTDNLPEICGKLASWIMILAFETVLIFGIIFIRNDRINEIMSSNISGLKYDFHEVNIKAKTTETEHKTIVNHEKDEVREETKYYYHLILEDKQVDVNKDIYDRVDKFGVYYLGMTQNDDVFSAYPATEFELEK